MNPKKYLGVNEVKIIKTDKGILLLLGTFMLAAFLSVSKEEVFTAMVTVIVALVGAGWLASYMRKRRRAR